MRVISLIVMLLGLASCTARDLEIANSKHNTQKATEPSVEQLVIARRAGMHMAATLLYQGIRRACGTERT